MASNVIPLRAPAGGGMGAAPAAKTSIPVLKMGMRGGAVLALQKSLSKYGFNAGTPDGIFGPSTEEALKALQRKLGVQADGVYGPATAAAIAADLAKPESILKQAASRLALPVPLLTSGEATASQPTTTLPTAAAQPAAKPGVPGWVLALAAAGVFFLWKRSKEAPAESPEINYAPSDYLDRDDEPEVEADDDDLPKPVKRKRASRRKKAVAEVEVEAVGDVPAVEPAAATPEAVIEAAEAPVDVEWVPADAAPAPQPAAQQTIAAEVAEVKVKPKRARKPMSEATKRMLADRKKAQRAAKAAAAAQ